MRLAEINERRAERAALVEEAGALLTTAHEEGRSLTSEEQERFNKMHAQADAILAECESQERQYRAELESAATVHIADPNRPDGRGDITISGAELRVARGLAFRNFFLPASRRLRMSDEQVRVSQAMGIEPGSNEMELRLLPKAPRSLAALRSMTSEDMEAQYALERELRAMDTGTPGSGEELVAEMWVRAYEEALLAWGGMRQASQIVRTATGEPMHWPTANDTDQKGEIIGENQSVNEQDVATGELVINAYKYSSKMVKVSVELLQDSAVDIEALIGSSLGTRIGRILNEHLTTGTGTGQPNGVVTASTLGHTAASNSAITFGELLALKHSVDPAYRPGAVWMFNDTTLLALKSLVDLDGRPLFQAGYAMGEPDRIDGDPYVINQDVGDVAASTVSALYGQFSKYLVRDVLGITMLVLRERFADTHSVAFLAFARHDGDLLDAGTNPIKHLAHPA